MVVVDTIGVAGELSGALVLAPSAHQRSAFPLSMEATSITADERDELLDTADEILTSVGMVGLSAAARREAVAAARGSLLPALDTIHVGTAVVVNRHQRRRGNTLRFCTGDLRQGEAAAACLGRDRVTLLPPL